MRSSARTFVLGKASQELSDAFAVVVDAQKHTVKNLKIGASPPRSMPATTTT